MPFCVICDTFWGICTKRYILHFVKTYCNLFKEGFVALFVAIYANVARLQEQKHEAKKIPFCYLLFHWSESQTMWNVIINLSVRFHLFIKCNYHVKLNKTV